MIKIIPAIDIIDGKCVRLTKGDYSQKIIYNENPLEVAKEFEDNGIKYLHLVDLDGAKAKQIINWSILESISQETKLEIDFGGGIRSKEDLRIAFQSGATKITAGSIAVKERDLVISWIDKYKEKVILGADTKNEMISINAWEVTTDIPLIEYIKGYWSLGIKEAIVTDISRDGVLLGPAFDLYKKIQTEIPALQLIASGGVSKIEDVDKLNEQNINGVIIGKAIYEGRIKMKELKRYLC
ncbi:MAG: 1-(5-phosphoribosyl)-5-[(5-phosphoribosylamino)methylideneamino]imidazole-4-carboxamide isomerase [Bacteroidetes bacterium]|nr:1-(5-phosphoribosyl)-5-[(5-phosphoribosylamino)methylideneamino]imidazole-4-carboxamide isomerase [Bacteroidota bacterium]MBU1113804.1 1-(5-phosphoribosyl)-5-[(5-phosphoribosylamino)methylideneamino]imidazole-4-carboxamide isomerase [Bacteroidota bacterium]MBU1799610.1 1-(5-phosphoribosyl)-5-[(5-phosphoribosylamino)methylideneamino]imidazole-4-carboxamide isomerase [Bacteroidota bacterium]